LILTYRHAETAYRWVFNFDLNWATDMHWRTKSCFIL